MREAGRNWLCQFLIGSPSPHRFHPSAGAARRHGRLLSLPCSWADSNSPKQAIRWLVAFSTSFLARTITCSEKAIRCGRVR